MTAKILVLHEGTATLVEAYTADVVRVTTSETPVFAPAPQQGGYNPQGGNAVTYDLILELYKTTDDGTRVKAAGFKDWDSWCRADDLEEAPA